MNIPAYIQELLCYETKSGRRFLLNTSTDYNRFPASALVIPGYLYRLDMQRYKYLRCFPEQVEKLVAWVNRNYAEAHVVKLVQNGWNTHAYITIIDPVALALEKQNLVGGVRR
jgi:hypothetical protein